MARNGGWLAGPRNESGSVCIGRLEAINANLLTIETINEMTVSICVWLNQPMYRG